MLVGCLRRLGRLATWLILRGSRLLWPPAWTQHDLEVCCSLMAVATFFFIAGVFYMFTEDSSKDPTKLDYSNEHREKLIQEFMKEKGWQLERDDDIYDEANIIKADSYINEIELDQTRKPKYRVVDPNKERKRKEKEEQKEREDKLKREKERDKNRIKKESQEMMQLRRENIRRESFTIQIKPGDTNVDLKNKKVLKLQNVQDNKAQPPLPPNVQWNPPRGKMAAEVNKMANANKMTAFINNPLLDKMFPDSMGIAGQVPQNGGNSAGLSKDQQSEKLVATDIKMSKYKKIPKMLPDAQNDGLQNERLPQKGRRNRIKNLVNDKAINMEGMKLVHMLNKPFVNSKTLNRDGKFLAQKFDLQSNNVSVYNLSHSINEDYECMHLKLKPPTKVCLYPVTQDVHVSYHIRREGLWEPHIVKEMQNELYSNPDIGLIDIGANIGIYSLVAAKMGHKVVAIEPYVENIKHLQMAAQLNNVTDKIVLLKNAISDERRQIKLELPPDNQGGVAIDQEEECTPGATCHETSTIFMDDLLHFVTFQKAIMKIDIEGHEHRAFRKATELFDKIYIASVYMEWRKLRSYYGAEITDTVDKNLTFDLVGFLLSRDYSAYSHVTGARLKPGLWYSWPDDIIWRHQLSDVLL